jgi:hypothetical protein
LRRKFLAIILDDNALKQMFNDAQLLCLAQEYAALNEPASFVIHILRETKRMRAVCLSQVENMSADHLKFQAVSDQIEEILTQTLLGMIEQKILAKLLP